MSCSVPATLQLSFGTDINTSTLLKFIIRHMFVISVLAKLQKFIVTYQEPTVLQLLMTSHCYNLANSVTVSSTFIEGAHVLNGCVQTLG